MSQKFNQNPDEEFHVLNDPMIGYASLDDSRLHQLLSKSRVGIPYEAFQSFLKRLAFTFQDWSSFLHVSERTLQRYGQSNKAFNAPHSERILQILMIEKLGIEVFGTSLQFHAWLNAKNIALGGVNPKSLLNNTFGIEAVKNELGRIQYGVLA